MSFTDTQEMLWDNKFDISLRKRNYPLDEHPREMYDRYHIIKLETITGRDFYLWSPSKDVMWTEERKGAYRYSDTPIGRDTRYADFKAAEESMRERGVDGRVKFSVIN